MSSLYFLKFKSREIVAIKKRFYEPGYEYPWGAIVG